MVGMLLPAGVWLMLSGATPPVQQRRLSAFALLDAALAALAFFTFGFALAFGAVGLVFPELGVPELNNGVALRLPAEEPRDWVIAGARGFWLSDVATPAVLRLFLSALPLPLTAAMLVAAALMMARLWAHVMAVVALTGVGVSLALAWTWAGGWLDALGRYGVLGAGFADLAHLSSVGCLIGAASVVIVLALPRRAVDLAAPEALPAVYFPSRAVCGALLALIGAAAPLATREAQLGMSQFVNTVLVASVAVVVAAAYTTFTTRQPDALSASRAMLAALFASAAGAAWLPLWMLALLGVLSGLAVTLGHYLVVRTWRLDDTFGGVSSVAAPSALGSLAVGLFGSDGQMLGLFAAPTSAQAVGQFWLQLLGVVAIGGLGVILALPLRAALRVMVVHTAASPVASQASESPQPAAEPLAPSVAVSTMPDAQPTPEPALERVVSTQPGHPLQDAALELAVNLKVADEATVAADSAAKVEAAPAAVSAQTPAATAQTAQPRASLWLKMKTWLGATNDKRDLKRQPPPAQHRAYPHRAAGRPLNMRPLSATPKSEDDSASST